MPKKTDAYDEPNPELGSAREAAEAAAAKDAPPKSATPTATDTPDNDKDKE